MSVQEESVDSGHPPLWRNGNFLRFFLGKFVTNAGDSLYAIATMWLVHELGGSTFLTGVTSSLLLLPYLLQIVAGPIVDRFPVKPVLVGTQLVQAVLILVLPAAAYTGNLTVGLILATVPVLSVMTTLIAPAQSSLLPRIVDDSQLSTGNSALATITIGLDMVFDALGGLFIAVFGATALFVLDSVTFAVAAALFGGMGIPRVDVEREEDDQSAIDSYLADLREGVDILRGTVFVEMLAISAVVSFAVGVTLAILPAVGDQLGGPAIYGLLLGALGIGRLVGSIAAPHLRHVPYGQLLAAVYLVAAGLWVGAAFAPSVALTVGLFGLAHVAGGINSVLTTTLNQKVFPTELLGRVSAIKGTAATATLPVGSLVGGFVAEMLDPMMTLALAASGFGFMGLWYALRPPLRALPAIADVDPAAFDIERASPSGETLDED
jgi:MFS family permease